VRVAAVVLATLASIMACRLPVTAPSDHTGIFASTDEGSPCWATRRTWTGEYGQELFTSDDLTEIAKPDCFPLLSTGGVLGWNFNLRLPRPGTFHLEFLEVRPPVEFSASLKTCGCAETCAGAQIFGLGKGTAWTRELPVGSYCLTVFPPDPQPDDVVVTVFATRP
jgi:hypothetical protein